MGCHKILKKCYVFIIYLPDIREDVRQIYCSFFKSTAGSENSCKGGDQFQKKLLRKKLVNQLFLNDIAMYVAGCFA